MPHTRDSGSGTRKRLDARADQSREHRRNPARVQNGSIADRGSRPGGSIHFKAAIPHRFQSNRAAAELLVVWSPALPADVERRRFWFVGRVSIKCAIDISEAKYPRPIGAPPGPLPVRRPRHASASRGAE